MDYELQVWIAVYAGEMASRTIGASEAREIAIRMAARAVDDLRAFKAQRAAEEFDNSDDGWVGK